MATAGVETLFAEIFILVTGIIAVVYGIINTVLVNKVELDEIVGEQKGEATNINDQDDEADKPLIDGKGDFVDADYEEKVTEDTLAEMKKIQKLIENGAIQFLKSEYTYLSIFVVLFAVVIACLAEPHGLGTFWTTGAFLVGALTSIISGYIGMRIAVMANVKTTKECSFSIHRGFIVAYRAGSVLGFILVGLALLLLLVLIVVYKAYFLTHPQPEQKNPEEWLQLFEAIAGFGLGGSTIALFGRVGGGIYTKAADVGADLAGKVVMGLPEDDYSNPGVIADNVGDNVGDIAGMGSDLFGSLAESTCAALVVSSQSPELINAGGAFYYPLVISGAGILVSVVTTFFVVFGCIKIKKFSQVELQIKLQLIISTVLMAPVLIGCSLGCLPPTFVFPGGLEVTQWDAFFCGLAGLIAGFLIGMITEYYTSNEYAPVRKIAESCKTGAAPNIIHGLAVGYLSCIIPIILLGICIFVAYSLAGMYGISLAAIGMLSTLCIGLTIDGYGPISDNAGGIAEMVELKHTRKRTDKLDAAGNTTAAIGKGFAIGSACLVALALFGAFATRTGISANLQILSPLVFASLIIGAMLPYAFTAQTMKAVGSAAEDMIKEIQRQSEAGMIERKEPDHGKCIDISTKASLKEMIAPGLLVMLTPIIIGLFFGPLAVAGLLTGSIVSGIQLAISAANSGGAWDNAKKFIEADKFTEEDYKKGGEKWREAKNAAVVGDTVGDPLKDTSGPSLNILIKLMAIISLVFGTFFQEADYFHKWFGAF